MSNSVTKKNLLYTLPSALQNDTNLRALATAVAAELEDLFGKPPNATIYSRIDSLDESLLDTLAADFKIDWWRPDATVQEKRECLKNSWYVHKHLGTKSAIEKAITDFLGDGRVEEWFEYGGKPHHFRIRDADNATIINHYKLFVAVLQVVQRGSSVLDAITARIQHRQQLYFGTAVRVGTRCKFTVDLDPVTMLTDSDGNILTDANGNILCV